jgi:hypothetical protein
MKTTAIVAILIGVAVIVLLWWWGIVARARRRAHAERMREAFSRDRARISERFEHPSGRDREGEPPRPGPSRRGGFFGGGGGGGPRPH